MLGDARRRLEVAAHDDRLATEPALAQPVGQCGIEVVGMARKPFGQRAREPAGGGVVSVRDDALPDPLDGAKDRGMLHRVALASRELRLGHPPLLFAKVLPGMDQQRIHGDAEFVVTSTAQRIHKRDELLVHLVHGCVAEEETISPGDRGVECLNHPVASKILSDLSLWDTFREINNLEA